MVAPLAAAGVAAAGAGAGFLLGGDQQEQTRKDVQVQRTVSPTINRERNVQRTVNVQRDRQVTYNPQVIVDSPDASIASKTTQSSKKGGVDPVQRTPTRVQPEIGGDQRTGEQGQTTSGGSDRQLLILAGAAVLLLSRGGGLRG